MDVIAITLGDSSIRTINGRKSPIMIVRKVGQQLEFIDESDTLGL